MLPSQQTHQKLPIDLFSQRFPHGFDILPTSSQNGQCGLYAVIGSMKAMNDVDGSHQLPVPSVEDLLRAYKSYEVQNEIRRWCEEIRETDKATINALRREGYFSLPEIQMALHHWAASEHDVKLQLGVLAKHETCQGTLCPNEIVGKISGARIPSATACAMQARERSGVSHCLAAP